MTTTRTLNAETRDSTGKGAARKMRAQGRVPGVVYGKDMDPIHLAVDANEAMHLFDSISVDNTLVELAVDGETHQTLVREIQTHPYRRELVHIDFLRVQEGVMVDVDIPIHLEGIPVGVKEHGGVLDQILNELPVKCVPSKIPEEFRVDVSGLDIGDTLHLSDIPLPEGVELTIDETRTLCSVAVPKTPTLDEEEAEAEAAEAAELLAEGEEGAEGEAEGEAGEAEDEDDGDEG